MVRSELIKRSPLRILENSTNGGVGKGHIGVIAGPKGLGKTACLVHIATDQLMQDKHVVHISFSPEATHIVAWYEAIFKEITKRYKLENAMDVHDEIVKNRIVMNFKQDGLHWPQIEGRLKTILESAHFTADTFVVDGYDFSAATPEEFGQFEQFAVKSGCSFWFTASEKKDDVTMSRKQAFAFLDTFIDDIAVLILLSDRGSYIHLELLKDHGNAVHDLHLKLDPQILLIAEEE
jgi:KaiC/GvpD/RAD55 family RecA-like ATPase